jgi:hypothetical protein
MPWGIVRSSCATSRVASGHLIELKASADIGFVTAILRHQGKPVTWMNSDIAAGRAYMKIFPYEAEELIAAAVKEAVEWAQCKVGERAELLEGRQSAPPTRAAKWPRAQYLRSC